MWECKVKDTIRAAEREGGEHGEEKFDGGKERKELGEEGTTGGK